MVKNSLSNHQIKKAKRYGLSDCQIEGLNNLPSCKNCSQPLDLTKLSFLAIGLNLHHTCADDNDSIISLQGSYDFVVNAWQAINKAGKQ